MSQTNKLADLIYNINPLEYYKQKEQIPDIFHTTLQQEVIRYSDTFVDEMQDQLNTMYQDKHVDLNEFGQYLIWLLNILPPENKIFFRVSFIFTQVSLKQTFSLLEFEQISQDKLKYLESKVSLFTKDKPKESVLKYIQMTNNFNAHSLGLTCKGLCAFHTPHMMEKLTYLNELTPHPFEFITLILIEKSDFIKYSKQLLELKQLTNLSIVILHENERIRIRDLNQYV